MKGISEVLNKFQSVLLKGLTEVLNNFQSVLNETFAASLIAALALPAAVKAEVPRPTDPFNQRAYAVGALSIQNCFAEKGWIPEEQALHNAFLKRLLITNALEI